MVCNCESSLVFVLFVVKFVFGFSLVFCTRVKDRYCSGHSVEAQSFTHEMQQQTSIVGLGEGNLMEYLLTRLIKLVGRLRI